MSYRRRTRGVPRGWVGGAPDEGSAQTAAEYADLARARRKADFRWFARSQGMAPPMIEQLWRELRAAQINASPPAASWRPKSARAAVRRGRADAAARATRRARPPAETRARPPRARTRSRARRT